MSNLEIVSLSNARQRMERLDDTHARFRAHLSQNGASQQFPDRLTLENLEISTAAFGMPLRAIPRIVRNGEREFAVEYTFAHHREEEVTPIWRFYLVEDGYLLADLSKPQSRICDFNNPHIAERLLIPLSLATLASKLFAPADRLDG